MYLYTNKIVCTDCGANFRAKKQHKHNVYICTNYHNKKSDCPRYAVKEDELTHLINKHFEYVYRYEFEKTKYLKENGEYRPSSYVDRVEVSGKRQLMKIFYVDKSEETVRELNHFRL